MSDFFSDFAFFYIFCTRISAAHTTVLRVFAEHQPVTLIVNAVRSLFLDQPFGSGGWQAMAWLVGLLVVFAPLSVSVYRKRTVR